MLQNQQLSSPFFQTRYLARRLINAFKDLSETNDKAFSWLFKQNQGFSVSTCTRYIGMLYCVLRGEKTFLTAAANQEELAHLTFAIIFPNPY